MNDPPGHVCQPTSRADTLRVLYSALSVTVSTFRSNNSPSPVSMSMCPPPGASIKCLAEEHQSSQFSRPHSSCNRPLHLHPHLHSWVATRTMYSPGHLRIPDKANSSVRGASSTGSKYVLSASPHPGGPDSTLPDRDQRAGTEHDHCLACDPCEQGGSRGQARMGPRWWSRTRCHREGQTFASTIFPI